MNNIKKISAAFLALSLTTFSLAGCGKDSNQEAANNDTATSDCANAVADTSGITKVDVTYDEEDLVSTWDDSSASHITLSDGNTSVSGSGVSTDGSKVTISAAGTYVVTGTVSEGQIEVNVASKGTVRLILNNASISNSTTAPIVVTDASKVLVTLAEGTTNTITDSQRTTTEAQDYSGAFYSKADLVFNGTGTLNVNAGYNDGIVSKDDLKIVSGTFQVTSTDDGIIGRDLLAVKDGELTINAGGDGMKSTYDTDTSKGNIVLQNGTYHITAANDALQSENILQVEDGTYDLKTAGGASAAVHTDSQENGGGMMKGGFGGDNGGMKQFQDQNNQGNASFQSYTTTATTTTGTSTTDTASADTTTTEETTSDSYKGLKAVNALYVFGGSFTIDSQDDSLHTNGAMYVEGGTFEINSGDDGMHADETLQIDNGTIHIISSYEGIESAKITINGGDTQVKSSDDGLNATNGSGSSEPGAMPGQTTGTTTEATQSDSSTPVIYLNGGNLYVNADGDGIDSNGSVYMTGGTVYVDGPTDNNNGALDYDNAFEVNGGTLIASGSSGMAQAPTASANGDSISMTFSSTKEAGTSFAVKDSSGNTIIEYTPSKAYQTVTVTASSITSGNTYTIVSNGTDVVTATLSDEVTYMNESGVTTNNTMNGGGMGGGRQGNMNRDASGTNQTMPDGQSAPDMSNMQAPDGQSAPDMSNMQAPNGAAAQ